VYSLLRTYQLGSGESVLGQDLFNFTISSSVNVDEEGTNQPHRTIFRGSYQYIATS